jgi:lysophospholipase L1-like esterase
MTQTTGKQKFLLISGAVIVTFVLIELSLLAGRGLFLLKRKNYNAAALRAKETYRILCIGESTTYLGGENNYPNYLSEILNRSNPEKSVVVINKGTPGISTDFILKNIEGWIERYQPDIVVAMMGINDVMLIPGFGQREFPVLSFLKKMQTYKLMKRIVSALNIKIKGRGLKPAGAMPHLPADLNEDGDIYTEDLYAVRDQFRLAMSKLPGKYNDRYVQAVISEGMKNYPLAERLYLSLILETDDEDIHRWIYKEVGELLQMQGRYLEFVELMPKISYGYWGQDWIDHVCVDASGVEKVMKIFEGIIENTADKAPVYHILAKCSEKYGDDESGDFFRKQSEREALETIHPVTRRNYLKLVDMLSRRNIRIVVVQYPLRPLDPLKSLLKAADRFDDVVFVDNEDSFKAALKKEGQKEYFIDMFAGDFGHCTEKGNRLLAANVASVLREEIFDYQ